MLSTTASLALNTKECKRTRPKSQSGTHPHLLRSGAFSLLQQHKPCTYNMSSSSFDIMQQEKEEAKGPLVEVSLQSLTGLVYDSSDEPLPNNITCAVGFAGSASDMQVSSSFLCGNTGNIVVESQSAVAVENNDGEPRPLLLEWREKELSQSIRQQAHLTIRLPERDPKIEPIPLSQVNRDCAVVNHDEHPPSLDESETSSSDFETASNHDLRGPSVVWSASGAAMPDIIELHVSLLMNQASTATLGTAFLVFYGSDIGTTVLDLPIKKPTDASVDLRNISLQEGAFLRVSVTVTDQDKPKPRIKQFFLQDMHNLEPIIQQLHTKHNENEQVTDDDIYEEPPQVPTASRFFCGSSDLSFKDFLRTLTGVVKNCEDGEGILHQTDSMGSTIVTTASHGI